MKYMISILLFTTCLLIFSCTDTTDSNNMVTGTSQLTSNDGVLENLQILGEYEVGEDCLNLMRIDWEQANEKREMNLIFRDLPCTDGEVVVYDVRDSFGTDLPRVRYAEVLDGDVLGEFDFISTASSSFILSRTQDKVSATFDSLLFTRLTDTILIKNGSFEFLL